MIAQIIINSNVKQLNRTFDYEIPYELKNKVEIGARVLVPFGNLKKLEEGFIVGFKDKSDYKTKKIVSIQEKKYINKEKVELAKWMATRYFCNVSDAIKLMLPPGTTTKNLNNRVREKKINFVYLVKDEEEIELELENKKIKSEKQIRILKFLIENGETALSDLELFTETSVGIIKTLQKNKYVEISEKQVDRNPFKHKVIEPTSKLKFTQEQEKAYNAIEEAIDDQMNSSFLIFGVTGSRKNGNIFTNNRKSSKTRKR